MWIFPPSIYRASKLCCDVLNYGQEGVEFTRMWVISSASVWFVVLAITLYFVAVTKKNGYLTLQLLGFFGGIHLTILVAFVCRQYPNASISLLMSIFFECFSRWRWPKPVILLDMPTPAPFKYPDGRSFMPIMMPCGPFDWCSSNITKSTFEKIKAELQRGHLMTKVFSILSHDSPCGHPLH